MYVTFASKCCWWPVPFEHIQSNNIETKKERNSVKFKKASGTGLITFLFNRLVLIKKQSALIFIKSHYSKFLVIKYLFSFKREYYPGNCIVLQKPLEAAKGR